MADRLDRLSAWAEAHHTAFCLLVLLVGVLWLAVLTAASPRTPSWRPTAATCGPLHLPDWQEQACQAAAEDLYRAEATR